MLKALIRVSASNPRSLPIAAVAAKAPAVAGLKNRSGAFEATPSPAATSTPSAIAARNVPTGNPAGALGMRDGRGQQNRHRVDHRGLVHAVVLRIVDLIAVA